MSDNKVSASAPTHLPTEIWLQIIGEFLTLPGSIHSDRWPSIKRARLDKMSIINREFSSISPKAFYASNKVVVKPSQRYATKYVRNHEGFFIAYPSFKHSHWVRELEYRAEAADESREKKRAEDQISWLTKLASGSLGFSRLSILRVIFPYDAGVLLRELEAIGPLYFTTKKLEIVVDGHCCTSARCAFDGSICSKHARLSKILLVKPQV
jgi:hypothetical protein